LIADIECYWARELTPHALLIPASEGPSDCGLWATPVEIASAIARRERTRPS
jgi:hypothetical protein